MKLIEWFCTACKTKHLATSRPPQCPSCGSGYILNNTPIVADTVYGK